MFGRLLGSVSGGGDRLSESRFEKPDNPELGNGGPAFSPFGKSRIMVRDVAIPRADIVAVQSTVELSQLVRIFRESGRSRLPVFVGSLDKPCGLVHLKDVALKHGFNGSVENIDLQKMVRPLLYVPASMPIGDLLQKMQTDRIHMALVIDEYGGVDGLVTIEDLVEQVFGEIDDEHDDAQKQPTWVKEQPGVYLCWAKAPLSEFEALIGRKLVGEQDDEEIDTLGGLVIVLTGRVPARGEVISHPAGLEIEIVDADPRRVKRLRIRVGPA